MTPYIFKAVFGCQRKAKNYIVWQTRFSKESWPRWQALISPRSGGAWLEINNGIMEKLNIGYEKRDRNS
jgi:hypothetical protein